MKANIKIKLLIISCVIIVSTLSLIQYYLVRNTYKLTKEKYYEEVRRDIGKIIGLPLTDLIEEKAQENLKYFARLYVSRQIDKKDFITSVKKRNDSLIHSLSLNLINEIKSNQSLKNVKYKYQYDEIELTYDNRTDTLLSGQDQPVVFLGAPFHTPNTLLISNGNNIIIDNPSNNDGRNKGAIKLQILRSQYIDVSFWKDEVWKRMTNTYLLAVLLIFAVILLYYLVFSAMLRQKKLAEMKTDFANNITHELKTPLSSVSLILKSLEREEVRSNQKLMNEFLSSLNRQHLKIQQVVDFVLESAMASRYEIKKENIEITQYLKDYMREIRVEKHIFVNHINPEKRFLATNVQILDKILNNLIDNAVKYSPEGSLISLKGYPAGQSYLIEVADEGPGMNAEDQPYIFDKFFRLAQHNKHNVKGLGLGLYLSKQAANVIGAKLFLKSQPGHGSVFILKLKNEQ